MRSAEMEAREIISRISKASADNLMPNDDLFEKLGIDSMQRIEILIELEKKFGIAVPDEEAQTLRKFSDFLAVVEKYKAGERA